MGISHRQAPNGMTDATQRTQRRRNSLPLEQEETSPGDTPRRGSVNAVDISDLDTAEDAPFLDVKMVRPRYGKGVGGFYIVVYSAMAMIVVLLLTMGCSLLMGFTSCQSTWLTPARLRQRRCAFLHC